MKLNSCDECIARCIYSIEQKIAINYYHTLKNIMKWQHSSQIFKTFQSNRKTCRTRKIFSSLCEFVSVPFQHDSQILFTFDAWNWFMWLIFKSFTRRRDVLSIRTPMSKKDFSLLLYQECTNHMYSMGDLYQLNFPLNTVPLVMVNQT